MALGDGTRLKSKGRQEIPENGFLIVDTPAGGGYGNPLERDPEQVLDDVRCGLVSRKAAKEIYGVSITEDYRIARPLVPNDGESPLPMVLEEEV